MSPVQKGKKKGKRRRKEELPRRNEGSVPVPNVMSEWGVWGKNKAAGACHASTRWTLDIPLCKPISRSKFSSPRKSITDCYRFEHESIDSYSHVTYTRNAATPWKPFENRERNLETCGCHMNLVSQFSMEPLGRVNSGNSPDLQEKGKSQGGCFPHMHADARQDARNL